MKKLHITKKFNNIKIGDKLLLSYILVVFLPVMLVGLILIYNMRQMVIDRAIDEASVNVDRAYTRLNEVLKLTMELSYKACIDQNLEELLLSKYGSVKDMLDAYGQYNTFNNYINIYSREIRDIRFYTYNDTILDNGQFIKITPQISDTQWFKKILDANGRICWQYLYDMYRDKNYFCLTAFVKANYGYKKLGALVVSINDEYLYNILKNEPYETFICDDSGNIIAARDKALMGQNIGSSEISTAYGMNEGIWHLEYKGQPSKAIVREFMPSITNGTFKIISIVPVTVIEKQTTKTAMLGIAIMVASLLLAFILIFIFTNAISKRVKKLSKDMHKVAMGDFDFTPTLDGEDEIGQLSGDLDIMVRSIKELIHEIYEINLQKNQLAVKQREIKLKMLANQINPHFLFNALETIRMKAHCKGESEIAEVVKLLGKIMRRNLEISNELVTLESEIDMVKSYLEIQKFRYGDRIGYEINLEDELKAYLILPLIIQPIIENSIVHGIEECSNEVGVVKVNITRDRDVIRIIIEDNGSGMNEDRLEYVRKSLNDHEDSAGKRIGLKNIHQRIKLCYGEEYGLAIRSRVNEGTLIEIVLPGKG